MPSSSIFHLVISTLIILLAGQAVQGESAGEWPRTFKAQPAKIADLPAPQGVTAAHQTAHFKLYSDTAIADESLRRFATVLESVPQVLERLPLPLWHPPEGEKPLIRLCRNEEAFRSHGGSTGAAGHYDGRKRRILIRADLFLHPPRASRIRASPDEDLLVHELTHAGMHGLLGAARPWLMEGLAEYLAAAHHGGGLFDFDDPHQNIRDHIRKYLHPDRGGRTLLPALGPLHATDGQGWIDANSFSDQRSRYRPYAASLLLVHYHLASGERRAALAEHCKELAAWRDRREPRPTLASGDPAEIEKRLTAYWSPRGLRLVFR